MKMALVRGLALSRSTTGDLAEPEWLLLLLLLLLLLFASSVGALWPETWLKVECPLLSEAKCSTSALVTQIFSTSEKAPMAW